MLLFLTGDIQTGKTRWLMRQIDRLEAEGVEACGVVAPGTWIEHDGDFEKTGIDNLLLPERRTVPFARRRDLARAEGAYDPAAQSSRAGLGWAIRDEAISEVDAHFAKLAAIEKPGRRLLVVDELGSLELERGGGLASAVAMLDRGATPAFPYALAVVRAGLLETARARFANAPWGGMRDVAPDAPGERCLDAAAG